VELRRVLGGLDRPVAVVSANDGSGRLFVAERPGTVRVVERTGKLSLTPFLDITKQVGGVAPRKIALLGDGAREGRGLLGMAFHPDFRSNGLMFVSYTDRKGDLRVSRFKASASAETPAGTPAASVDPTSEKVLLKIARRPAGTGVGPSSRVRRATRADHNGGQLSFGPDKYLYITTGDSGGIGDPGDTAQDRRSLRGKVLRIGVDERGVTANAPAKGAPAAAKPGQPYLIPSTNPFAKLPAFRGEIWALGLRDPRGLSFDRKGGQLWVTDTGDGLRQEVNRLAAGIGGRNLGWDCREGTIDVSNRHGGTYCATRKFSGPLWNYRLLRDRCSIVGGTVYRGTRFVKELDGKYLYADHCSGEIWALGERAGKTFSPVLVGLRKGISAFGEDESGEVVVATADGVLHRLVIAGAKDPAPAGTPPARSATTTTVGTKPVTAPGPSTTQPPAAAPATTPAAPTKMTGASKSPIMPSDPRGVLPATEPVATIPAG
jgi:glucose/arabinose dehydrogenase